MHRGERLLRKLLPNAVIALAGTPSRHAGVAYPFFQETNFLYLTGWREPGAMLIMASEGDFLFIPKRGPKSATVYTGRKAAPEDLNIAARTGFENVLESSAFASKLKALATRRARRLRVPSTTIQNALPGRELQSAERPLARLRMIKSRPRSPISSDRWMPPSPPTLHRGSA
jgi:Xaa-Pro aminopeptidase